MQLIRHQNTLWEPFENELYRGWAPSLQQYKDQEPTLSYVGPKMPMSVYRQALAFMKWSYELTKGESQGRFYLNEETGAWACWIFPQEKSFSLSTKELPDHPGVAAGLALFPSPWEPFGTIHHHCDIGAFQSGTDHADEIKQPGLHITIGHLAKVEYDFHARVSIRGAFYGIDPVEWFELPEAYQIMPKKVRTVALTCLLTDVVTDAELAAVPQAWKDNLIVTETKLVPYTNPMRDTSKIANGWVECHYEHPRSVYDRQSQCWTCRQEDYDTTSTSSAAAAKGDEAYERFVARNTGKKPVTGFDPEEDEFEETVMDFVSGEVTQAINDELSRDLELHAGYTLDTLFGGLEQAGWQRSKLKGDDAHAIKEVDKVLRRHAMTWFWFMSVYEAIWGLESEGEAATHAEQSREETLEANAEAKWQQEQSEMYMGSGYHHGVE